MADNLFQVIPESLSGYENATEFCFNLKDLNSDEIIKTIWDLGDGVRLYDQEKITHTFRKSGTYTVNLSVFYNDSVQTDFRQITIEPFVRDVVLFSQIPEDYPDPGKLTSSPFVVEVTSAKVDTDPVLILYASGTQSTPSKFVPSKWKTLVPKWRFIDADRVTEIETITVSSEPIFYGTKIVGRRGKAAFYYVDDLGTTNINKCPLLISVTLSSSHYVNSDENIIYANLPSHANSMVARATTVWQINHVFPTRLGVTCNHISNISPYKWKDVPIPVMITCESSRSDFLQLDQSSAKIQPSIVFSYPSTNQIGNASPINLSLSGLDPSKYKVETQPLVFQALDSKGGRIGGYVFTTITPLVTTNVPTRIIARTIINQQESNQTGIAFPFPQRYSIVPFAFLSHPLSKSFSKVALAFYPSTQECATVKYFKDLSSLTDSFQKSVNTSSLFHSSLGVDSSSAVSAVAVDPKLSVVYIADSTHRRITQCDFTLKHIASINLQTNFSPACIAIDSQSNVWVAAYNASHLNCFNSKLQQIRALTPINTQQPLSSCFFPAVIETDRLNGVWIAGNNSNERFIICYNANGAQRWAKSSNNSQIFPANTSPMAMTINGVGNMWICHAPTNNQNAGVIQLHDANTGNILKALTNVFRPAYIAMDRQGFLWIASRYGYVSKWNPETNSSTLSTWKIEGHNQFVSSSLPTSSEGLNVLLRDIWGGLTVDAFDRVWLINRLENKIYVFPASREPTSSNLRIIDVKISKTNNLSSLQAAGDWMGNKWFQKYATTFLSTSYEISGVSEAFSIGDLKTFEMPRKKNSTFNMSKYFDDLALPEILKRNRYLFETFFPALVGDGNYSLFEKNEDGGAIIYEKIANFVENKADIDVCDINQIVSFAALLGIATKHYNVKFPRAIQNAIDLFSINPSILKGKSVKYMDLHKSKGVKLNPKNSLVHAGTNLILVDKQTNVALSAVAQQTTTLDLLQLNDFILPISDNYDVYLFGQPHYVQLSTSSLVDWPPSLLEQIKNEQNPHAWNQFVVRLFDKILTENTIDV